MKKIDNHTNKSISEFTNDDTLYMQKIVNGFIYTFLIKFVKFEKGMVTGEIISIEPNHIRWIDIKGVCYEIGSEISSRILKCYTYKKLDGCHWFQKNCNDWSCVDR